MEPTRSPHRSRRRFSAVGALFNEDDAFGGFSLTFTNWSDHGYELNHPMVGNATEFNLEIVLAWCVAALRACGTALADLLREVSRRPLSHQSSRKNIAANALASCAGKMTPNPSIDGRLPACGLQSSAHVKRQTHVHQPSLERAAEALARPWSARLSCCRGRA